MSLIFRATEYPIEEHTLTDKDPFSYGIAGCIDVETTGLSPYTNEIIELGLVLFAFNRQTGKIIEVLEEYTGLREPVCSISWGASRFMD